MNITNSKYLFIKGIFLTCKIDDFLMIFFYGFKVLKNLITRFMLIYDKYFRNRRENC